MLYVALDKEPDSALVPSVETTELLVQREQGSQNLQGGASESTVWESSEGPAGALAKSLWGNPGGRKRGAATAREKSRS